MKMNCFVKSSTTLFSSFPFLLSQESRKRHKKYSYTHKKCSRRICKIIYPFPNVFLSFFLVVLVWSIFRMLNQAQILLTRRKSKNSAYIQVLPCPTNKQTIFFKCKYVRFFIMSFPFSQFFIIILIYIVTSKETKRKEKQSFFVLNLQNKSFVAVLNSTQYVYHYANRQTFCCYYYCWCRVLQNKQLERKKRCFRNRKKLNKNK